MKYLHFEWDEHKNITNRRKHGVTFEEARSVFFDEHGRLIADPDHSEYEERFLLLGMSLRGWVLMVSHCYRAEESVIRIISARRANATEEKQYQEHCP
jgi:uncharacterized protein